jgi:hypothetical protein
MEPRNFRTKPIKLSEAEKLFCAHCDSDRDDVGGILAHLKMRHDLTDVCEGADYLTSVTIGRRLAEEDAALEIAAFNMESLIGVDDFLLECRADA